MSTIIASAVAMKDREKPFKGPINKTPFFWYGKSQSNMYAILKKVSGCFIMSEYSVYDAFMDAARTIMAESITDKIPDNSCMLQEYGVIKKVTKTGPDACNVLISSDHQYSFFSIRIDGYSIECSKKSFMF